MAEPGKNLPAVFTTFYIINNKSMLDAFGVLDFVY